MKNNQAKETLAAGCVRVSTEKSILISGIKTIKTAIIDNWHFWESNGKILASNEVLKKLYSFDNFDNACNWLMAHDAGIARRFYKHWKTS